MMKTGNTYIRWFSELGIADVPLVGGKNASLGEMLRELSAQGVLGVDRDSEIVVFDFDERDAGVTEMIRQTVEGRQRNQRHVGICGQAPSDYPEVAQYLVEIGIDSISLNPDSIIKTTRQVLEVEQRLGRAPRPPS
ncbi:MAG: putative PEP-binding protein [Oxalobacteraceae bacterium]